MNIIGTGLSGLVGSRIVELMSDRYQFKDLSRKTGVDITDSISVSKSIADFKGEFVLHFAAFTQVDLAELDRSIGQDSLAWKINVNGTKNVISACQEYGKHLIFLSTDMVFSGEKPLGQKYSEEENPNPVGWYAETKFNAEKLVIQAKIPWTILRIAYPYKAIQEKNEYVHTFLSLLKEKREIKAVSDHYFTPTFIDDLALVIDLVIKNKLNGIYHAAGDEVVSPFIAALEIAKNWELDQGLVYKTTREEYFKEKAKRAFNLSLNNDKIKKLGINMHSFTEGIREIKNQIKSNF